MALYKCVYYYYYYYISATENPSAADTLKNVSQSHKVACHYKRSVLWHIIAQKRATRSR